MDAQLRLEAAEVAWRDRSTPKRGRRSFVGATAAGQGSEPGNFNAEGPGTNQGPRRWVRAEAIFIFLLPSGAAGQGESLPWA